MASAEAWAYNAGLEAEPSAKSRAPGQGAKPPEAEAFLAFGRSMEAANLPTFQNFGTQRHQIFMLSLQKIMGGHETGGAILHDEWCLDADRYR